MHLKIEITYSCDHGRVTVPLEKGKTGVLLTDINGLLTSSVAVDGPLAEQPWCLACQGTMMIIEVASEEIPQTSF